MITPRNLALAGLILATTALIGNAPAFAAHTYLEARNGTRYEVSPAMIHAIDVIVAEKMKMMRRRH